MCVWWGGDGAVAGNLCSALVYLTDFAKTVSIEAFRKDVDTLTLTGSRQ